MKCLPKLSRFEQIDGYYSTAICVANIPLCLAALLGNTAILTTIWKTPSLHSPAHILLASLAVTDFAFGLIAQPLLTSLLLTANYYYSRIFQINCLVFYLVAYFFVRSVLYHCYSHWLRTTSRSSFALEIQFHNNYKPCQTCHSRHLDLRWTLSLRLVSI